MLFGVHEPIACTSRTNTLALTNITNTGEHQTLSTPTMGALWLQTARIVCLAALSYVSKFGMSSARVSRGICENHGCIRAMRERDVYV
jgi:hypothetical protein